MHYSIDAASKGTQAEPRAIGSDIWVGISAAIASESCLIKVMPQSFLPSLVFKLYVTATKVLPSHSQSPQHAASH